MKRVSLILLLLMVAAPAALADNIVPPPWSPLQDGATHAEWEFLTPDMAPPPDVVFNPYGLPQTTVFPSAGQQWQPVWGGRLGVWPLSGLVDILIPNRPEPLERKEIWLQVTWAPQMESECIQPVVQELIFHPDVAVIDTIELGPTGEAYPSGSLWRHTIYHMVIEPNPDMEVIRVGGAIMIDEIVIDTICIPEPASLALLGAGLCPLLARRRRAL